MTSRKAAAVCFAASYLLIMTAIAFHIGSNQMPSTTPAVGIFGLVLIVMASYGIALIVAHSGGQAVIGTVLAFFGIVTCAAMFPGASSAIGVGCLVFGTYGIYRLSR